MEFDQSHVLESSASFSQVERPSLRVLLAEDDFDMRLLLDSVFCQAGYEVITQADGRGLVSFLASSAFEPDTYKRPDVIVSDVRMPGHSGLEVVKSLRENDVNTPVILISAFADASMAEQARKLDVTLLSKPFLLTTLKECLRNIEQRIQETSDDK